MRKLSAYYLSHSLVVLATILLSFQGHAADTKKLNELFQKHFWGSLYKEGKCGPNIQTFVRMALSEGIDMDGATVVHLENKGGDMFGLVSAVQAREQGKFLNTDTNSNGPKREPGEANWYYHAFLLADGYVFDFDFQNNAIVLMFDDYVYSMFVPAIKKLDIKYIRNKFSGYYLSFFRVKEVEPSQSYKVPISEILEVPTNEYLLPFMEEFKRK